MTRTPNFSFFAISPSPPSDHSSFGVRRVIAAFSTSRILDWELQKAAITRRTPKLDRRQIHSWPSSTMLLRGLEPRLAGRNDDRGGTLLVHIRVADSGRRDAVLAEFLHRTHQPTSRGDDPKIRSAEVLLGAIANDTHAVLRSSVLSPEFRDA